jgi:adhesin transport system membrane fusion protein
VKKDEVLLELEPIKTLADFSEIEKRLTTLSINIARLRAESENKKLFFSKEIKNDYPNLVKDALQLFEVRKNKINATLEEQSNFLKNEINSLKLLEEQVLISKSLLEEQLTNRLTHLDLLKEKNSAIAKIDTTKSAIKKKKETHSNKNQKM